MSNDTSESGPVTAAAAESAPVATETKPSSAEHAQGLGIPSVGSPPTLSVPMAAFVRGGGAVMSTSEWDSIQRFEQDAERRRDVAAMEKKIAKIPIEHGGGRIYEHRLTSAPEIEQGYVLLEWVNGRNEKTGLQCLADVQAITAHANEKAAQSANEQVELQLVLVCPRCKERGIPQGQCQLAVRQSNRSWHLDQRHAGEIIAFEGAVYRSAGRVVDSEPIRCPRCAWRARIHNNMVREV